MNIQRLAQRIAQPVAPVIEVARNQERTRWGNYLANPGNERGDLPLSTRPKEPEVNHKTMHLDPVDPDHAVEYPPALENMIRHVEMIAAQNRESRQKRVAVMAVQIIGIAPISRLEHRSKLRPAGQKNLLAFTWPMLDVARMTVVTALHLLQKDQIGLELV